MMKVKFVLTLALLTGIVALAICQAPVEVPATVKTAFAAKYPEAQKVKWELEAEGEYEAEFELRGKEMSANFISDGNWIETETEIRKSDLPQVIKTTIEVQYSGHQVEKLAQVETPDQPLTFEVELEKKSDDSKFRILFKTDGSIIKKEMKKGDDDTWHLVN